MTEPRAPIPVARPRRVLLPIALGLSLLLCLVPRLDALKKPVPPEELFNPLLGIEYAYWLVGPVYEMATENEVEDYLLLADDEEAAAFVAAFWQERNAGTKIFEDTPQDLFEQRAVEADKRYTEAVYPGRRTARGTVFILYGEPEEVEFQSQEKAGQPPIETWSYPKGAGKGLDGEPPKKSYRFITLDGRTERYTGQRIRQPPRAGDRFRGRGAGLGNP